MHMLIFIPMIVLNYLYKLKDRYIVIKSFVTSFWNKTGNENLPHGVELLVLAITKHNRAQFYKLSFPLVKKSRKISSD